MARLMFTCEKKADERDRHCVSVVDDNADTKCGNAVNEENNSGKEKEKEEEEVDEYPLLGGKFDARVVCENKGQRRRRTVTSNLDGDKRKYRHGNGILNASYESKVGELVSKFSPLCISEDGHGVASPSNNVRENENENISSVRRTIRFFEKDCRSLNGSSKRWSTASSPSSLHSGKTLILRAQNHDEIVKSSSVASDELLQARNRLKSVKEGEKSAQRLNVRQSWPTATSSLRDSETSERSENEKTGTSGACAVQASGAQLAGKHGVKKETNAYSSYDVRMLKNLTLSVAPNFSIESALNQDESNDKRVVLNKNNSFLHNRLMTKTTTTTTTTIKEREHQQSPNSNVRTSNGTNVAQNIQVADVYYEELVADNGFDDIHYEYLNVGDSQRQNVSQFCNVYDSIVYGNQRNDDDDDYNDYDHSSRIRSYETISTSTYKRNTDLGLRSAELAVPAESFANSIGDASDSDTSLEKSNSLYETRTANAIIPTNTADTVSSSSSKGR